MKWNSIKLLIASTTMAITTTAGATKIEVWDKKPIDVQLEVGKEQLISFPDAAVPFIPNSLTNLINIQSANGIVYIEPIAEFSERRVKIKLPNRNSTIFMDFFAVKSTDENNLEPIKVVLKEDQKIKEAEAKQLEKESMKTATPVQMFRHAQQRFYSPPRLQNNEFNITETEIKKPLNLSFLFSGASAASFEITPISEFRAGNKYLTALKLTNKTSQKLPIIYTDIEPVFQFASARHTNVDRAGTNSDTTMLFLITEKSMTEMPMFADLSGSEGVN